MSRVIHSAERLAQPFSRADERLLEFSADEQLKVVGDNCKMIVFLEGEADMRVDGGKPVRIRDGDVLIVLRDCQQVYTVPAGAQACRLHVFRILFDAQEMPLTVGTQPSRISTAAAATDFRKFVRQTFPGVTHLPGFLDPGLQELIFEARRELEAQPLGYRYQLSGICYEFVTALARRRLAQARPGVAEAVPRAQQIVDQARHYLTEHLAEPLTLGSIAWALKLSDIHLARVFKQTTGQTVFQYLTHLRIERAKVLLHGTPLTSREISRQTGFSSPTLFGRTFRTMTGLTPGDYRARAASLVQSFPSKLVSG